MTISEKHIKTILYNIILGVNDLHKLNILHRDLKPANILVNENCTIKIADFGLARSLNEF
jgi:mitogen-activated protein kinase 1/3